MSTPAVDNGEKRRFAVFDIDGTIFRWQLFHELFDALHRRGIITSEDAEPIFTARRGWRERKSSFNDYDLLLVNIMERQIIGLEEKVVLEAVDEIMELHCDHVYRYTTELIRELKRKGYTILAISGSQHLAVERFAAVHGIDVAYGVHYGVEDGVIAKQIAPVYGRKGEILRSLVEEHNLTWENSYAVGDTSSDIDMLELVANPVAFNPDEELYKRARDEQWPIVVERKNMIYKFEPNGNLFVLA